MIWQLSLEMLKISTGKSLGRKQSARKSRLGHIRIYICHVWNHYLACITLFRCLFSLDPGRLCQRNCLPHISRRQLLPAFEDDAAGSAYAKEQQKLQWHQQRLGVAAFSGCIGKA